MLHVTRISWIKCDCHNVVLLSRQPTANISSGHQLWSVLLDDNNVTDIIKQEDSNATSKIHNCSYLHATEDARASVSVA